MHCKVAEYPGSDTNYDRRNHTHKTRCRSYGYKTCDRSCYYAYCIRLSSMHPAYECPCKSRCRCCGVRNNESTRSKSVCCQGASGIETEPAKPQEHTPDYGHRDIVRGHVFVSISKAFPDNYCRCEG